MTESENIRITEKRIINLINQHLTGWTFKWSNARLQYGCCYITRKIIRISKPLVMLNSWEETQNTVLHEIAHALAGPNHGHDDYWKKICVEIGAKPERCYGSEVNVPVAKYYAICEKCGKVYVRNRKPRKARYSCGNCSHGFDPDNVLEWVDNPLA